jgi:alpha-glucoside transport system substrate-binding protein
MLVAWHGTAPRAALVAVAALVVAGCTGPDAPQQPGGVGSLTVEAVWGASASEKANFGLVLDKFSRAQRIRTAYKPSQGTDIDVSLRNDFDAHNLPDVAILPSPGLLPKLRGLHLVVPLDPETASYVSANYDQSWRDAATLDGRLYGVFFKATNKSVVWYNRDVFARARMGRPATYGELVADAQQLHDAGVPPVVIGADANSAWSLTDWFENVYLSEAGPVMYDQLARHQIKWTDQSVKTALGTVAQIWSKPDLLRGGTGWALNTSFDASVTSFAQEKPAAGMLYEGDFVENAISLALAGTVPPYATTFGLFPFPPAGATRGGVIVGGDMAVLLRDSREGRSFMRYLASPESAMPWIRASSGAGFYSPNRQVPLSGYPAGRIGVDAARQLATASIIRFDMSDSAPPDFGSRDEWQDLSYFLGNPTDVDGTASRLEEHATFAYSTTGDQPPQLPSP